MIDHDKKARAIQLAEIKANKALRQQCIAEFAPQVNSVCLNMQKMLRHKRDFGTTEETETYLDKMESDIRSHFISMFGCDMIQYN